MQLGQRLQLCRRLQVNKQVAAAGEIDTGEWRVAQQVVAGKYDVATQRPVNAPAFFVALEKTAQQRVGNRFDRFVAVDAVRGAGQHRSVNVGGKNFDVAGKTETAGCIECQHGQRIGFLAAGAAGRPYSQVVARIAAAQQIGEYFIGQQCENSLVAEKFGDVDQQILA